MITAARARKRGRNVRRLPSQRTISETGPAAEEFADIQNLYAKCDIRSYARNAEGFARCSAKAGVRHMDSARARRPSARAAADRGHPVAPAEDACAAVRGALDLGTMMNVRHRFSRVVSTGAVLARLSAKPASG